MGNGFIVTPEQAVLLDLGRRPGLEAHIRPYRNGRDLSQRSRAGANTPRFADNPGQAGTWGELGASVSFNATKAVAIDLSLLQTVSFPFGDTTVGILGLRFKF